MGVAATLPELSEWTLSTKLGSTSWGPMSVDQQAHCYNTMGLRPRPTVQKACTRGLSN